MIKKPMFRQFYVACALLGVSTFSALANPELEERVAVLEQQLIQAQAESVAFGQRNIELVEENTRLRDSSIDADTKLRFEQALANVVDHSAEMREQLAASQDRIENLAHELQRAMRNHRETQEMLEAKHRSLFAHATTLQGQLAELATLTEPDEATDSYFEEGWSGESESTDPSVAEEFPVPGDEVAENLAEEEEPIEIAATDEGLAEDEFNFDDTPAEIGIGPATSDPEPFFDANASFEEEASGEESVETEEVEDAPYVEEEVEATFDETVESEEPTLEIEPLVETEADPELGVELPSATDDHGFFDADSIFDSQPEFDVEAPADSLPFFELVPSPEVDFLFESNPANIEPLVIIEILEQV